ncbi:SGNH/GDSL hydrolase family protein [Gorillibacterium sp. sgz5001074]|uniref:SGNH/GDSL hydrolase family protein n=1 Tax=Gorillibacterium sp. sgz5001074 TaxID=3446695 RepID=UPI003F67DCCC
MGINNLTGKTFNILGDSMVHGHTLGFSKTWAYQLAQRNGMTVRDYGINGTCLAGTSNGYGPSMATRYVDMDNTADYIGVFGGTNDQTNSIPIGTDTDSTVDTFKGALNVLCSGLITKYPTAKIFFITPYNRNAVIQDYVDAIIAICATYSIPVFDNYRNGGVCWTNSAHVTALTMNDTYHLNEAGMQYASTKYEAFMNAL